MVSVFAVAALSSRSKVMTLAGCCRLESIICISGSFSPRQISPVDPPFRARSGVPKKVEVAFLVAGMEGRASQPLKVHARGAGDLQVVEPSVMLSDDSGHAGTSDTVDHLIRYYILVI